MTQKLCYSVDWGRITSRFILEQSPLIDFFITNYPDFSSRKNASRVYRFSRETVSFLASLDNVFIVGAGNSNKLEAVSVFAYTMDAGDFLFNVSLPEGQHHSAALLWYGVNYLKSLHIPLLNLGGGIRENDGVAQFKRRFGGKELPLRSLKQIYRPEIYEELCRRVNADPTDMTGYFLAYRKP